MNLDLVLQLGALRAVVQALQTDSGQDAELFARAQSAVDAAVKVLAVVVALDTALLLMVLQQELGNASRVTRCRLNRWRTSRRRAAHEQMYRDAKTELALSAHRAGTGEARVKMLVNEYRARATARLLAKLDSLAPTAPTTPEETVDRNLGTPPQPVPAAAGRAATVVH